ncbi:PAS domain S-box protein [bacterium]|nr:PAS domain S-box protein [bacterium]
MQEVHKKWWRTSTRVFVLYLVFGGLWILLSDHLVQLLPESTANKVTQMQTAKGLFFVFTTGIFLLLFLRHDEKRARSKDARFRLFADNALDVVFRLRLAPARRFEYISPSVTRILGYPQETFYEDPDFLFQIVQSQDHEVLDSALNLSQDLVSEQIRWVARNGNSIWTSILGRVISEPDGKGRVIEGILRDISEQKSAEAEQINAVNQLTAVFRASPLPTFALDLEGCVLLWNEQAEKVFGYSADEVIGKSLPIVRPEDRKQFMKFHEQMVLQREIRHGLGYTMIRKDETTVELRVSAAPWVDEDGEIIGSMNVAEDISQEIQAAREKSEMREQLYHAQRLESVGRLAGGVAHDINNALSVILMNAEFMQLKLNDAHELSSGLDEVVQASERASKISRQLLAFSRKQSSKPEHVDLTDTVERLKKMLRRLVEPNIKLEFDLDLNVPVILIDPTQLEQIIVNLVVNARDAIGDHGSIKIQVSCADSDEERLPQLSVSDSGHGMDEATLEKIFDPFFTTKPKELGTGLGLSTVYGIVEQHSGTIDVDSRLGEGTTFTLTFPATDTSVPVVASELDSVNLHGDESILIIEDENLLRASLRRTFNLFGYHVTSFGDGEKAVEYLLNAEKKPDLILTDVIMPGLSGVEVIESLPQECFDNMAVLFMSGYYSQKLDKTSHENLVAGFIQKPFSQRNMLVRVRKLLQQRSIARTT